MAAASVAMGSWVARTSAKTAVNTINAIRSPPAAPRGFLRTKRQSVLVTLPRRRVAAGSVSSISPPMRA